MADMTTEEQIDQAFELARNAPEKPVADHIQFDSVQRLLLIHLSTGRRLVLPLEDIQKLGKATHEQLEDYDLLGDGYAVEWPQLDIAFRIEGLLGGVYGNKAWMQQLRRRDESAGPRLKILRRQEASIKAKKSKKATA